MKIGRRCSFGHGAARQGSVRRGTARQAGFGTVRQALAMQGWHGRQGVALQRSAGLGAALQAGRGRADPGIAGPGVAWQAGRSGAGQGLAWISVALRAWDAHQIEEIVKWLSHCRRRWPRAAPNSLTVPIFTEAVPALRNATHRRRIGWRIF